MNPPPLFLCGPNFALEVDGARGLVTRRGLGQESPGQILIHHRTVSSPHATWIRTGLDTLLFTDLKSRNGLWIESCQVQEGTLRVHQQIRFGSAPPLTLERGAPALPTAPSGPRLHIQRRPYGRVALVIQEEEEELFRLQDHSYADLCAVLARAWLAEADAPEAERGWCGRNQIAEKMWPRLERLTRLSVELSGGKKMLARFDLPPLVESLKGEGQIRIAPPAGGIVFE